LVGQGRFLIGVLVTAAAALAFGALWWLALRGRLSVEAVSLAVLSVAVLADKAFAPQYLIWLIPLWAYWPLRRGWVATAAVTTLIYPVLYASHALFGYSFYFATAAGALRNSLLIVTSTQWLVGQLQATKLARTDKSTASAEEVPAPRDSGCGVATRGKALMSAQVHS